MGGMWMEGGWIGGPLVAALGQLVGEGAQAFPLRRHSRVRGEERPLRELLVQGLQQWFGQSPSPFVSGEARSPLTYDHVSVERRLDQSWLDLGPFLYTMAEGEGSCNHLLASVSTVQKACFLNCACTSEQVSGQLPQWPHLAAH